MKLRLENWVHYVQWVGRRSRKTLFFSHKSFHFVPRPFPLPVAYPLQSRGFEWRAVTIERSRDGVLEPGPVPRDIPGRAKEIPISADIFLSVLDN